MRIRISVEEAAQYLEKFFETYPGVRNYITSTMNFAATYNFTYTFTGRRRRFPLSTMSSGQGNRMARQAVNARIQTTSSDIVTANMVQINNRIKPLGGRVLLTVHDSIVFQLPKGTPGVRQLLDDSVLHWTKENCPWLPVDWKYDCGKGPNYGDTHGKID
jgi:DNA polymerase-1